MQTVSGWRTNLAAWTKFTHGPSPVLWVCLLALLVVATVVWNRREKVATREWLLNGRRFSDAQLAQMSQAFARAKLTGYQVKSSRISVPVRQSHRYLAALAEAEALPREFQSHTDAAFSQQRWLESDRDRQSRLQHAREKDLALALRSMQGIENAMVQYDEVESSGFSAERQVTACVAVLPSEGHVLDRQQIQTIRRLVAWAKAGMKPSHVNVTDLRLGRAYVDDTEESSPAPLAEEYLQIKRAVERDWTLKVRQTLRFIPEVQVVVDVDLGKMPDEVSPATTADWTEPQRIAVSVGVPARYLRQLARSDALVEPSTSPPSTTSASSGPLRELVESRVQQALRPLLPDPTLAPSAVAVTIFDEPTPPVVASWAEWQGEWQPWLHEHRYPLGGVLTSLVVGILVYYGARRVTPPQPAPVFLRAYREDGEEAPTVSLHRGDEDEALRAELAALVRDDPDHAAELLHRWIDKAS